MNLHEAWKHVKNGKKIRRNNWSNEDFYLDESSTIDDFIIGNKEIQDWINDVEADDWVAENK